MAETEPERETRLGDVRYKLAVASDYRVSIDGNFSDYMPGKFEKTGRRHLDEALSMAIFSELEDTRTKNLWVTQKKAWGLELTEEENEFLEKKTK